MKADPRERILEVVDRLFYTEGVRATGTEKIMAMAQVAKATFYHHFPSKDDLVVAYLERRDRALWDLIAKPASVREVLLRFEQWANRPDVVGCPFLRIASEYPDPAHPFHRIAIEHQNRIRDCLAGLLEPSIADRRAAATALLSIIDGGLTLRMLYGTAEPISIVALAETVLRGFQRA